MLCVVTVAIVRMILCFPASCLARHVSLCRIRRLRVGDTFRDDRNNRVKTVVATDNKHVLVLAKHDWGVYEYMLYRFDRTEAGTARQRTFLSRPVVRTSGLIMMTPHPDRRMGQAELAMLIANARVRAPLCITYGDPQPHSISISTIALERIAWGLERPVRIIQHAWRAWWAQHVRRQKRAVAIIEDAVLEAMYRPGSGWRYLAVRQLRWDTYAH